MSTFEKLTQYGHEHQIPILMDESMEWLEKILLEQKPSSFLEVGSAIGRTSITAAQLLPELRVVTIERDPEMAAQARKNIQEAGLSDRVTLIEEDAREVSLDGQTFDLIFIDAAKSQYRRFFEKFSPLLAEDGLIITDNMFFHGLVEHPERTHNRHTKGLIRRLKAYWDFLETNEAFETVILDIGDGIALTRRKHV
ncbi:O-methyltransferase [Allobaculum mucilyticum]|nr:O-methyltransferase [Allobaculum mucilyticum]